LPDHPYQPFPSTALQVYTNNMNRDYKEYLLSPEWRAKRIQAFQHYGRKCCKCARTKNLQIHHKTYINIFNEPMEDLMVLCKRHHEEIHGINKVRDFLIKKVEKKKRKKKGKGLMAKHKRFVALHHKEFKRRK
jgi:hypothetical protein